MAENSQDMPTTADYAMDAAIRARQENISLAERVARLERAVLRLQIALSNHLINSPEHARQ